jgi:hypothetical protein
MRESKYFFFEKKKQKTFIQWLSERVDIISSALFVASTKRAKVFWSFFSKKDCLLSHCASS